VYLVGPRNTVASGTQYSGLIRNLDVAPLVGTMPREPIDLPPAVARCFLEDMHAFYAEANQIKRDEIAGRQMSALQKYQAPRERLIRISDVKEMFRQMMDES